MAATLGAGVDVGVLLCDGVHFCKALAADADGQDEGDLVFGHVGEYFGQAVGEAFEIEVAVRVYKLHGNVGVKRPSERVSDGLCVTG